MYYLQTWSNDPTIDIGNIKSDALVYWFMGKVRRLPITPVGVLMFPNKKK